MSGSAEMEMEMDFGPSTSVPFTFPQIRPMGISPNRKITKPEEWYQGNRWPPVNRLKCRRLTNRGTQLLPGASTDKIREWTCKFHQGAVAAADARSSPAVNRQWSSQFYAIAVLGEFVLEKSADPTWDSIDLTPTLKVDDIEAELSQLEALIDYRPNVIAEALSQRGAIDDYFRGILSFTQTSHPATFGLMQIALRTGELQAMHYKYKFNRPRPSTLSPWLMPPIEVPSHASYPSGHSTQAHLIASLLAQVMPGWAAGEDKDGPLWLLAERIARNREVLGLHYPSDSEAGKTLAEKSFGILSKCKTVKALIIAGQTEWGTSQRKPG